MPTTFLIDLQIDVLPEVNEQTVSYGVVFDVLPFKSPFTDYVLSTTTVLDINPIPIKLREMLTNISSKLISNKVSTFYDEDRSLKTLLNFGNDLQYLVTNWKYNELDDTGSSIILKLYRPLDSFISEKDTAWISTEISPPLIDQIWLQNTPQVGTLTYLRPSFTNVELSNWDGTSVDGATLITLYSSSNSSTVLTNRNSVIEQYYTTDLKGVLLNVDYSDYKNFVHFGSAEERLLAFATKLETINIYDQYIQEQSSSLAFNSGSIDYNFLTSSIVLKTLQEYENRKVDIIRSFDGYERFMYYEADIPYSGTLTGFDEDTNYYHTDATWPKSNGQLYPVTSASIYYATKYGKSYVNETSNDILPLSATQPWLDNQLYIAREYDNLNANALVNNLPRYIISEEESLDFLKFIKMIGHHFDGIKPYIDSMTSLSNRNNSPTSGLSAELVWHIAKSTGFELPSEYSLRKLQDYVIGNDTLDPLFYSSAEIWKRILHNQIHILKTKGTSESINALMNAYGITPGILRIREGVTPNSVLTSSYSIVDESTYVLNCVSSSYVDVKLANIFGPVSSSLLTPLSIEVRFATKNINDNKTIVLNTSPTPWALAAIPTDRLGNGYIALFHDNSASFAGSSSIMPIFDGNYNYVAIIQHDTGSMLHVKKFENDDIKYSSDTEISTSFLEHLTSTSRIFLGSSGSLFGTSLSGSIDEFRVWGYPISETYVNRSSRYPGLYSGDFTSSAATSLFIKLSFNSVKNLFLTSSINNETPFLKTMTGSAQIETFDTYGFGNVLSSPYNFSKITRTILKYELTSTGNRFATNNIIIADDPIFRNIQFNDTAVEVPALRVDKSIKLISDKIKYPQPNNFVGIYLSLSDTINDSILRSVGYIDLEQLIGDPEELYNSEYSLLKKLSEYYWKNYAYVYDNNALVDYIGGSFAGFFKQLKNLVPIRTKLITGHVIEPTILERNKIKNRRPVVQGDTKLKDKTELLSENVLIEVGTSIISPYNPLNNVSINLNSDYINLESDLTDKEGIIDTYSELIRASAISNDLDTTVDTQTDLMTIQSEQTDLTTDIQYNITEAIVSELEAFESIIGVSAVDWVAEPGLVMFDEYSAREMYIQYLLTKYKVNSPLELSPSNYTLYKQELAGFNAGIVVRIMDTYDKYNNLKEGLDQTAFSNYRNLSTYIYETILSVSNLTKKEDTTYFMNTSGVVVDYEYIRVRYLSKVLISKGNWSSGTIYFHNDFVVYTFTDGSTREYRCITSELNRSFISILSPDIDYNNWEPVGYVYEKRVKIKKVIELNNEIQIVRSTHPSSGFTGYSKKHYKYHRFSSLGMKRSKYLGCVQSNTTTIDGKEPIETSIVKVDQIYVNPDISAPIQRPDDLSGPILDVR